MKKNSVISLLMLLVCPYAYSQPDSTLLAYHPLHVGNYWEYQEEIRDFLAGTSEYSYFSLEALADTIMPNSKRYVKLDKKDIPDNMPHEVVFERIDSTVYNIYRYDAYNFSDQTDEFLIDSLALPVGESFDGFSRKVWRSFSVQFLPVTITHIESKQDTLFNQAIDTKHFSADNHIVFPDIFQYWLAKDVGLIRGYEKETTWEYHLTLRYARINGRTYGTPVSVREVKQSEQQFALHQNYPNPFNASTTLSYELSTAGQVELSIFNLAGQKVKTVYKGFQNKGSHQIEFDAGNLATGIYVYQIRLNSQYKRRKLLLLK